ncbi:MAG: cytochrome c [Deltaproteobacteria bacterium]|nr:cytochrome c [Deltaproteobacteria bacterium]
MIAKKLIAIAGLVLLAAPIWGGELDTATGERLAQIVKGGLLYDNWAKELEIDSPKTTHVAYPKSGKYEGGTTWRCKECHGWDYAGKDGAYANGKHYTGIKGIRGMDGGSESQVMGILRDKNHGYDKLVPESALKALAAFVVGGQIDVSKVVGADKSVSGDLKEGGRLYHTICARCHGADGKLLNFGDQKTSVFVGTITNDNPWEIFHKVRFGQPKEEMVSTVALTTNQQKNILAYIKTLPLE